MVQDSSSKEFTESLDRKRQVRTQVMGSNPVIEYGLVTVFGFDQKDGG